MALHKKFPKSLHEVLDPKICWFLADEALREKEYGKLLPPLVHTLRQEIKKWCDNNYEGVSDTSRALLQWWFQTEHPMEKESGVVNFQFRKAQSIPKKRSLAEKKASPKVRLKKKIRNLLTEPDDDLLKTLPHPPVFLSYSVSALLQFPPHKAAKALPFLKYYVNNVKYKGIDVFNLPGLGKVLAHIGAHQSLKLIQKIILKYYGKPHAGDLLRLVFYLLKYPPLLEKFPYHTLRILNRLPRKNVFSQFPSLVRKIKDPLFK